MVDKDQERFIDSVSSLLSGGIELEAKVLESGLSIREQSKQVYGADRLDARLTFMAVAQRLMGIRSGVAGRTSDEIEERLALIALVYQGAYAIENLISEGQYIKTAAAIKQDYEALARLVEIEIAPEARKVGDVPNVKYLPQEARRYYGELNDVAHITKHEILKSLLRPHLAGESFGISPIPVFHADVAVALYDLHLWLLSEALGHHMRLHITMYGESIQGELLLENQVWSSAIDRLRENAGWREKGKS